MQVVQWLGVLPVASETGFPSFADYKFLEDVLLPEAKDLWILEVERCPFQRVHEFSHVIDLEIYWTGSRWALWRGTWEGTPTSCEYNSALPTLLCSSLLLLNLVNSVLLVFCSALCFTLPYSIEPYFSIHCVYPAYSLLHSTQLTRCYILLPYLAYSLFLY